MSDFAITITNLEKLQSAFRQAPDIAGPEYAKGINVTLANIDKLARDSGDSGLFRFKTPRIKRTGFLSNSFGHGIVLATLSSLSGSIGPVAKYAKFVEFGTSRGIKPNAFMERIRDASLPDANNQMMDAVNRVLEKIANKTR